MKTKYTTSSIILFAIAFFCPSPGTYAGISQGSETNTKNGNNALQNNTTGTDNSAYGVEALFSNTTGNYNTAIGFQALYSNTTEGLVGFDVPDWQGNTATGYQVLYSNTTGSGNVASGFQALYSNTTGIINTGTGRFALLSNTTGFRNTGDGDAALFSNTTGSLNTATGWSALGNNTIGTGNIALGAGAGHNLDGDNNIDIGNDGVSGDANTIRIGNPVTSVYNDVPNPTGRTTRTTHPANTDTYIAGIFGSTTSMGMPVYVDSSGKLGTLPSAQRFKQDIAGMDKASEAILSLRPVTFRYKKEIDPKNTPQFGLIAEEVAKVNPNLVARDDNGEIYSVRYEAVNAMLLNEFLKEHRQVQEQQKQIDKLTAELKEQAALIQKVNARVELNESRTQTVANQ